MSARSIFLRIGQAPLTFTYSLLVVVFAVDFSLYPGRIELTPAGHYLDHPWDRIWLLVYGIAAVLILLGYLLGNAKCEVAGNFWLAAMLLVDGLCAAALGSPWQGLAYYAALLAGFALRGIFLMWFSGRVPR